MFRSTLIIACVFGLTLAQRIGIASDGPRTDDAPPALHPLALTPLPLGAIRPAGWLKDQLRIQAGGQSGHLDEFWPDIKDSSWIGGKAEGWERVPYWLDGVVPLAYLLDDETLKGKVKRYIDTILDHQQPDGWLGPIGDTQKHKPYDVWPLFPLFKALTQYQEATGDPRVIPALWKCAKKIDEVISKEPLYSWAQVRAADFAVSLYWLHDRTHEAWLLDLARKAFAQSHDWTKTYDPDNYPFKEKTTKGHSLIDHGVNTGMALKYGAVRWRLTGTTDDFRARSACSRCSTSTTASRPASSPATSTSPAASRSRAPSCVPSSRRCMRSKRTSPSPVTPSSATVWKCLPSTPCRAPSSPT